MGKLKKGIEGLEKLSLGISIVVAVLLGVAVGYGLEKLFGYRWLFWLGVVWGIAAAILNIYKAYKNLKRELEEAASDPRYRYQQLRDDEDEDDA